MLQTCNSDVVFVVLIRCSARLAYGTLFTAIGFLCAMLTQDLQHNFILVFFTQHYKKKRQKRLKAYMSHSI